MINATLRQACAAGMLCLASLLSPAQDFLWVRSAGGVDHDVAKDICIDDQGNIWSTGYVAGDITSDCSTLTGIGSLDVSVVKYGPLGNCILSFIEGGPASDDVGHGITTDAGGNVYITGGYTDSSTFGSSTITSAGMADVFVAKYSASGAFQWVAHGGGSFDDEGRSVSVDPSGNVFVCGHFRSTATFGPVTVGSVGNHDVFLSKLDASGNWLWTVRAGGLAGEDAFAVATDASGNAYVTGHFSSSPAIFGTLNINTNGGADIFLAKFEPGGNCAWVRNGGGNTSDQGNGLAVDAIGNSYVTGWVVGDTVAFGTDTLIANEPFEDVVLARYSTLGDLDWVITTGGTDVDQGTGVALNDDGEVVITGNFSGSGTFGGTLLNSSGGVDVFVAAYDTTGAGLWAAAAGGPGYDPAGKVASDDVDRAYINGGYDVEALFGTLPLTAVAGTDHYVAKLGPMDSGTSGDLFNDSALHFTWDAATGQLQIITGVPASIGSAIAYQVMDEAGRQVITGNGHLPQRIDLASIDSGIYLVLAEADGQRAATRVVIAH